MAGAPMTGWLGSASEMLNVLRCSGAEKDAEGRFLVSGELPVSFVGAGEEYVVGENVLCRVRGQWVSLATLLLGTSYGARVEVY